MSDTHATPGVHHHAHHFKDADHEFTTAKQGMWLFLLQEVLFFSPFFVALFVFGGMYPADFHFASKLLDWKLGGLNTLVLLTSSLTMALAVNAAQTSQKEKTVRYLWLTFLCACGFLVIKYFEYSHKIHLGTLMGGFFHPNQEEFIKDYGEAAWNMLAEHPKAPLFYSIYFGMTGLHGLHVVGGMVVIFWLIKRASRGEFNAQYYTPVEMVGLYWHFVDLVWIYLFPLLYLVG